MHCPFSCYVGTAFRLSGLYRVVGVAPDPDTFRDTLYGCPPKKESGFGGRKRPLVGPVPKKD